MAQIRPLPSPGASSPLSVINLRDFSGGIVSRNGDSLDVRPNELRDAKNVVLQTTGGIASRGGFVSVGAVTNANYNPALMAETPDGKLFIAFSSGYAGTGYTRTSVDGVTFVSTTVTPATVTAFSGSVKSNAIAFMRGSTAAATYSTYVLADYIGSRTYKDGVGLTPSDGTWQNSYASPSGSYFPRSRLIATHLEYMFCGATYSAAATVESSVRLRWSHPGDAGSWREDDWIDMPGGSTIQGIVSVRDQLVVFTDSDVYVIRGYSAETFSLQQISTDGIPHPHNHSMGTLDGRVFWMNSKGVWEYNGSSVRSISSDVDTLMVNTSTATTRKGLGSPMVFVESPTPMLICPFLYGQTINFQSGTATNAGVWVWHSITRAWVFWSWTPSTTGASYNNPTICAWSPASSALSSRSSTLWCMDSAYLQRYDPTADADNVTGSAAVNIDSYFVTPWVDLGQPAVDKTWKRPEMLYRSAVAGSFTVTSYVDYVDTADRTLTVANAGSGANYEYDKMASLGSHRSISLKVQGPTATNGNWSIENIALKYRSKPLRN